MLTVWILVFIFSIALLVKAADWFIESSEKIGLALRISPFIIGVTIVAFGTSFPELASALAAVFRGATEIVVANAIGSNIGNILLIVGGSAVVARTLIVKRSLIDLDSPLLSVVTFLFLFMMWDKEITFGEGILLILGFLTYFLYTVFQRGKGDEETSETREVLPSRVERRRRKTEAREEKRERSKLNARVFLFLALGVAGLVVGANYTIQSMLEISDILKISSSLMAITALAVGTSLPELVVSIQAAAKKKYELALGNIFGSNVFNILLVVGIPALIKPLIIDDLTFNIGLPFLAVATLIFVISGISRRIHLWEGAMYLLVYILFIAKLCDIF